MGWLIFIIAACIVEGFFAWQSFGGTHPFPLNEFGFQITKITAHEKCLLSDEMRRCRTWQSAGRS